jgi:hypothetical protein
MKLTKLEQFVNEHPFTTWDNMADMCNTTPQAMINAWHRLERKLKAAREERALQAARDHNTRLAPVPGWSDFCSRMGCKDQ